MAKKKFTLTGTSGNDILQGGTGNDRLYGGAGDDTLDGGAGDDYLSGESGNDVYLFGRGAGQDTVSDSDTTAGNTDTIRLAADVLPGDLTLLRQGDDLVLGIAGTSDTLTVQYWFQSNDVYRVEQLQFADGSIVDLSDLQFGTASDDMLSGTDVNSLLMGYAGNDTLDGGVGADMLIGGMGNDTYVVDNVDDVVTEKDNEGVDFLQSSLSYALDAQVENLALTGSAAIDGTGNALDNVLTGNSAANVLDGGAGNDTLIGDAGNDTYLFGRGAGNDVVNDYDTTSGNADTVQFGTGVTTTDLALARVQDDLLLTIRDTGDSLTLTGYFTDSGASPQGIEKIQFVDGSAWDWHAVQAKLAPAALILNGTEGDDQLVSTDQASILNGLGGNDRLTGGSGNDTLDGGAGDDRLDGGSGNDTYLFGHGSGSDVITKWDGTPGKHDIVLIGEGVTVADIDVSRDYDDLILTIRDTGDRLDMWDYFRNDGVSPRSIEEIRFADGTVWDWDAIEARMQPVSTEGDDRLFAFGMSDTINGLGGNDFIEGRGGDDVLDGGAGDDTLDGGLGDDVLDGGAGDDTLEGGLGNDTFLFGRASGNDMIVDRDSSDNYTPGKFDAIKFGAGVTAADIDVSRSYDDLQLTIRDSGDSLTVSGYFANDDVSPASIEEIQFADGTVWNWDVIKARVPLVPTEGNDVLLGFNTPDVINGLGGDDTIEGRGGDNILDGGDGNDYVVSGNDNDHLIGGAGDDVLYASDGNDTLDGGAGNDYLDGGALDDILDGGAGSDWLQGGEGSDTYLFGRGSGRDVILYDYSAAGSHDMISFGADVLVSDVEVSRDEFNLTLTIRDTGDTVQVSNYFINDGAGEEGIVGARFADGSTWDWNAIKAKLMPVGTEGDDILYGFMTPDVINGLGGNDTIIGGGGNDTLDGGAGDDYIDGGAGGNQLFGGTGNDALSGGGGIDFLDGGAGDDKLYGWGGSDTYVFDRGYGHDIVVERDTAPISSDDTVLFGSGINPADVAVTRYNDNLILTMRDTDDSLTVSGYFLDDYAFLDRQVANPQETSEVRIEQFKFADGTVWDWSTIKAQVLPTGTDGGDALFGFSSPDTIDGLDGNDYIEGRGGNDILDGGAGDDRIDGGSGSDMLLGNAGTDILWGGSGDDTLDGGAGDDVMVGGAGNDVFLFGRGFGSKTIATDGYGYADGDFDAIRLAEDVLPGDVMATRESDDLVLRIADSADKLVVQQWFATGGYGWAVDQVQFADGSVWDVAQLETLPVVPLVGTEGADGLYGGEFSDNTLLGLGGNDWLYGYGGDDTLDGGAGNDYLDGGTGNDTYLFGRGAGEDAIRDSNYAADNIDLAVFGADVAHNQLWFQHVDNNLEVSIIGTSDRLTIENWYYGSYYHVEQFDTADGKTLLDSDVENLVSAMSTFSVPLMGQTTLAADYDAVLAANWH